MTSSYITSDVLGSRPGTEITQWVGEEVFDDLFGMSPKASQVASRVSLQIAGTLSLEKILAHAGGASPTEIKKGELSEDEISQARKWGYASDEKQFGPSLKSEYEPFDTINGLQRSGKIAGTFQKRTLKIPFFEQIGAQHSSANMLNYRSGQLIKPSLYMSWAVCHQATNLTLLEAGSSSTMLDINPSWDMFFTTAVYGNYGGQLGNRIYSGIDAYNNQGVE